MLGRMEMLGFALRSEASLAVLTADAVKSSAIEGEVLNAAEVRSSIARRLGLDQGGLVPAGRRVEGVVEMLLDATQNFSAALTEQRLFGWQAGLFPTGYSGTTRITVGGWRTEEAGTMQIVSGAIGRETVHFEAPAAQRVPVEMQRFLAWFQDDTVLDPVLKAGLAHFWFVTIHPFEDGNGRLARALADLALARADGIKDRFYSMSAQIEGDRKEYYRILEACQRGDLDITPWLAWFVACLGRALAVAEQELEGVLAKARLWELLNQGGVNDRQRIVVNRMMSGFEGHLTTSKYAKLAKCSADTALRDIRELVARGVLVVNSAGGRSTSYRLATNSNQSKSAGTLSSESPARA